MDLLGAYSDSDAEGERNEDTGGAKGARPTEPSVAPSSIALRNAAPDPDIRPEAQPTGLFNPFAEGGERQASTSTSSPSGSKRGFTHVTGSGPIQPGPQKASKTAGGQGGPKPAFNTTLVPPQLRNGRANVSTEDMDRIFSKGALAKRTTAPGKGAEKES